METRRLSPSCIFSLFDIPIEGIDIAFDVDFKTLYNEGDLLSDESKAVLEHFRSLVSVKGSLFRVASKVDVKGAFQTPYSASCDRCNRDVEIPLNGRFDTFLMAKTQFSPHDKPGGKVIHSKRGSVKPSRHHSRSKAEELLDAEGEHEDENFGAFDGQTVDLRPLIRENILLQIPMRVLCSEACKGLCQRCGEVIDLGDCRCKEGPLSVVLSTSDDFKNTPLTVKSLQD